MPDTIQTTNGWHEWSRYVLAALKELKEQYEKLDDKTDQQKLDLLTAINDLEKKLISEKLARNKELAELNKEILQKELHDLVEKPARQRAALVSGVISGTTAALIILYEFLIK